MQLALALVLPLLTGALFAALFGHKVRGEQPMRGRILLIAVVAIPAVVLGLSVAGNKYVPGSDLPSWIEAVSTTAALSAAALAVYFASNAYRLERDRETARIESDKMQQASLVAAWPGEHRPELRPDLIQLGGLATQSGIWIRNGSTLPITRVTCLVSVAVFESPEALPDIVIAGELSIDIVPPSGDQASFRRFSRGIEDEVRNYDAWASDEEGARFELRVALAFFDSADRQWRREWAGALSQVA